MLLAAVCADPADFGCKCGRATWGKIDRRASPRSLDLLPRPVVGSAPSPAGPGQVKAASSEVDLKNLDELLRASRKSRGWPLTYLTPGAPPDPARQQEPPSSGV